MSIKCLFGKHDISPYVRVISYGVIFYRCRRCGKLIDSGERQTLSFNERLEKALKREPITREDIGLSPKDEPVDIYKYSC